VKSMSNLQNLRMSTNVPSFKSFDVEVVDHIPGPVRAPERHLGDRGDAHALRAEGRAEHVRSWRA